MIKEIILLSIRNFKKYFFAQVKLFVFVTILFSLGFQWINIPHALLLGLLIAFLDLLPVLGSGMVFIPWTLIAWYTQETDLAWKLALIYILAIILKQILEPFFIGKDLSLPFYVPILITLISTIIFNGFGLVIASIAIPIVSSIFQYRQLSRNRLINRI